MSTSRPRASFRASLFAACVPALVAAGMGQPTNQPATRPSTPPATHAADPLLQWEKSIKAFERADEASPFAPGGIVFAGSSSIQRWTSLERDMAGLRVLNRGVGGFAILDVIRYADRAVLKYQPSTIVFYAGDNDLAARAGERPEEVLSQFKTFVELTHHVLPGARIVFVSLKPSPAREQYIEAFGAANAMVEKYIKSDGRLAYADVFTPMLDPAGKPKPELFGPDHLHMTPAGYRLWTGVIRPMLGP